MTSKVRLFKAIDDMCPETYTNAIVPQIGSTVFIGSEPFTVVDVTYDYDGCEEKDGYVLIDVICGKGYKKNSINIQIGDIVFGN